MRSLFLISSAINTKFGVFDTSKRLEQTMESISSVRLKVPGAKIILLEMAAIPLSKDHRLILERSVDELIEYHSNEEIQEVFKSDNWDIVKNVTEVACFILALDKLINNSYLNQFSRVYKLSGRYVINCDFDHNFHISQDKIIVSRRRRSQFPFVVTGVRFQYMSRLWSWPAGLSSEILNSYKTGFTYIKNQISRGRYCDIEHMLYKYLPEHLLSQVDSIGVEGLLGPNGILVKD
jgi:hypothetical protein